MRLEEKNRIFTIHDMLSKALYYARSVIVNDSNDEFEHKGDTKG